MKAPKGKRNFRKRFSDGRPEGEVTIDGELLRITFNYSPQRVAAIKLFVPRARFHSESKSWTLPLSALPLLESSPLFSREKLTYSFAQSALQGTAETRTAAKEHALAVVHANPFSVSEEIIKSLELDVVIRLSEKGDSLRAFPRFRSPANEILERISGSHLIKSERSFYLPTVALTSFLKKLRDDGLSFAVESSAGDRLARSADVRNMILKGEKRANSENLFEAVLTPFIELYGGQEAVDLAIPLYTLHHATTPQLKELFPDTKSFSDRKKLAAGFDESTLVRLVSRARRTGIPLFLSATVARDLERKEEALSQSIGKSSHFDEAFLSLISLPLCWIGEEAGRAGLLVERDFALSTIDSKVDHPLSLHTRELHPLFPNRFFYWFTDSILLEQHKKITDYFTRENAAPIPESTAFISLKKALAKRKELLDIRNRFQSAKDLALPGELLSVPEVSSKLFPHQRVAVSWLLEHEEAFLGDDMGLGKTLSILVAFDALKKKGACEFLLVACPNSLTRNWVRECNSWFPSKTLALLPQEKNEKIKFLRHLIRGDIKPDGLVLNYEALRLEYVFPELQKLLTHRPTFLCLDESQRVKNHTSKTFEALALIAPHATRKALLSGTPTPKDISDIWAQMFLLDRGERFGTNFYEWLGSIAELGNKYSDYAVKQLKPHAVRETVARVHEILLRRKKEDVINLPEKTFSVRDIELSGDQLERYEEVCDGLLLRVTSLSGKTFVREIDSVLEEYLRAVQMASNPRLVDESWKGEPAKFKELDTILQEVVGEREEKIVVWTNYLRNVAELVERYTAWGAAPFSGEVSPAVREETVRQFQKGKDLKVLVAVPAAGGVGITLTAAQTAVYVEKTWNAEHWLQSVDRVHRIGQTGTVNIISLSAGKVDEFIAKNLKKKERMLAQILGDKVRTSFRPPLPEEVMREMPTREELLEALRK